MARPADPVSAAASRSALVPPHSLPAEQAVLGGLMFHGPAWDQLSGKLIAEDFYHPGHILIFQGIEELRQQSVPVDFITLSEWLRTHGTLDKSGGTDYLAELVENVPGAANIQDYARIVREFSLQRQLALAGAEIVSVARSPKGEGARSLLDRAEKMIFELSDRYLRGRRSYLSISSLLKVALNRIEQFQDSGSISGVATGFADFDELTAGLQPSDLVIVAGRPSMGKTAFAINIAEHVALKGQKKVAVFSMEMPGEQLAIRMLASLARVDQRKIRTGRLREEDWSRLSSAVSLMQDAPIFIDDSPALAPLELSAACRRLAHEHGGLDLVIVDYLQLMHVPKSMENRATEISEISRSLKVLAKELNIPLVALSQLNRSVEQRPNKRPIMSDLRESGAIEQDADLVVFIYRDEVYDPESAEKGVSEIIIGKQRNGPIGLVRLSFLGSYTRFENYVEDDRIAGGDQPPP